MSDLIKRLGASCYLAFEDGTNDYSAAQEAIDRITDLRNHNKDLTLQLLAAHGQAADALDKAVVAEAKLATCEKYRDAYAECDRIGTQAVRDLEAKLAKAVEDAEKWRYAFAAQSRKLQAVLYIEGVKAVLAELEVKK